MQKKEKWLVILFLSRKKFHAKQICVLSSAMKLGPGHNYSECFLLGVYPLSCPMMYYAIWSMVFS